MERNSGYIVSFGGTFGNNIYKGEELLPLIPDKETLFRVTDAAINFFEKMQIQVNVSAKHCSVWEKKISVVS